eukprot:gb/GFBE01079300.1/.p1 GENE.gb/GFBE01079300.1/~~gb/GFBE01079300.1/.p1  ORF type:complete len:258 (+),score=50.34 gb/GFBE01079300.1/:1-774(+)
MAMMRSCMAPLQMLTIVSLAAAYPSLWWADWKADGGCNPPVIGEFIMGNDAEKGRSNISLELQGKPVSSYSPGVSYVLHMRSPLPAGHLLHVSSGTLSGLPSAQMNCQDRSAAWYGKSETRSLTWTPSGTDDVVITLSAAEDYLPVGVSSITLSAASVRSFASHEAKQRGGFLALNAFSAGDRTDNLTSTTTVSATDSVPDNATGNATGGADGNETTTTARGNDNSSAVAMSKSSRRITHAAVGALGALMVLLTGSQ